MVIREANAVGSNVIVVGLVLELAVAMAFRRLIKPLPGGYDTSVVVLTTMLLACAIEQIAATARILKTNRFIGRVLLIQ